MTAGGGTVLADLQVAERRLAAARSQNDPDELAEALAVHANALVQRGRLDQARAEIDQAVDLHQARGRTADVARYALLAATLCRLQRQFPEARARAQRAAALSSPGTVSAFSAAAELGEIALAEGQRESAVAAFGEALGAPASTQVPGSTRIALYRKRAAALTALGRHAEALADLEGARTLALAQGDERTALLISVEQVTALQQGGDSAAADVAREQVKQAAVAAGDHGALAQLFLLEATRAVERRDGAAALAATRAARTQALAAVAPIPYLSAAVALSELLDASGDRLGAYEALAVGWVTLSDLLGREAARAAFEPKLSALRAKWGVETFAATKSAYEARRRADLARAGAAPHQDV